MDKPPCVKEIVLAYLIKLGYVGLHRYQCACSFDDLIRCQDGEAFDCTPTMVERRRADRRTSVTPFVSIWRRRHEEDRREPRVDL